MIQQKLIDLSVNLVELTVVTQHVVEILMNLEAVVRNPVRENVH